MQSKLGMPKSITFANLTVIKYRIVGFFEGENFHEFHIIRENFPREIFIYNCVILSIEEDTCRFMSRKDLSACGSLLATIPSSRIEVVNRIMKPLVESVTFSFGNASISLESWNQLNTIPSRILIAIDLSA